MLKMQNCCENETFTLYNNILVLAHFYSTQSGFFHGPILTIIVLIIVRIDFKHLNFISIIFT